MPLQGILGGLAFSAVKAFLLFLIGRYLIFEGRWVLRQIANWGSDSSNDSPAQPGAATDRLGFAATKLGYDSKE